MCKKLIALSLALVATVAFSSSLQSKLINLAGNITGTLAVINGGTGTTTSTGSGNTVLSISPTLVTPTLGAATATSVNFGNSSLGFYESTTISSALNGATTAPNVTIREVRTGDMITIHVGHPGETLTKNSSSGGLCLALDTGFTPAAMQSFESYGAINAVEGVQYWVIQTSGNVCMFNGPAGNNIAANTTNVGWSVDLSFSYTIN